MIKHNQKEKTAQEITIHRSLNHANIVKFHSYFEDVQNIYIVLELCKKRVSFTDQKKKTLKCFALWIILNRILDFIIVLN